MPKSNWEQMPNGDMQIWCPHEFDLSGSAIQVPIFYNEQLPDVWGNEVANIKAIIKGWFIVYTEASSADAGVTLELGYDGDPDYFDVVTSEVSKAQHYVQNITQNSLSNDRVFSTNGKLITAYCAGGKTGTGNVRIGLTISFDYTHSISFTP
jgi:hypothetical protein